MKYKGINIEIIKGYYQKAQKQENNVFKVDNNKSYPLYELNLNKTYYDMNKEDVLNNVIVDLKDLIKELEKYEDKELEER